MSAARFHYYLRVRYPECDAQKVVFNSRYGEYVDLAVTEFLRALGHGEALISGGIDYQLVRQVTEWKAPVRFDQVLDVAVSTQKVGNTSFVLLAEFRVAGEERVLATVETTYVMVDAVTLVKAPLPDAFRATLERGAPGVEIDHAGHLPGRGQTVR